MTDLSKCVRYLTRHRIAALVLWNVNKVANSIVESRILVS